MKSLLSFAILIASASLLAACNQTAGAGGGITGLDPMGPFAPGPVSLAVYGASALDPTGGSAVGIVGNHVMKAEMDAQVAQAKIQQQKRMTDLQAAMAQAEAAKQMGIRSGILNPDGSQKVPQPQ